MTKLSCWVDTQQMLILLLLSETAHMTVSSPLFLGKLPGSTEKGSVPGTGTESHYVIATWWTMGPFPLGSGLPSPRTLVSPQLWQTWGTLHSLSSPQEDTEGTKQSLAYRARRQVLSTDPQGPLASCLPGSSRHG